ncbi:family 2A encapsulin nanocompartment cargo protein cysteine desulfurase [Pararhodospirillum photometricum]|uniref:cysteine desulfurase n=1 Tax=Pararhodospirillum photometricum DSM 122 TaxID=1150469 RepID=H6SPD2_PARPM|nr:family 2A encapsulin nanocompartment cargo protein cysteine desulfurase [Pararhodospirillum photometricum]CCG09457.1 Cysteine desulfurase [Pararhodospirillum photometricum DSM 122]
MTPLLPAAPAGLPGGTLPDATAAPVYGFLEQAGPQTSPSPSSSVPAPLSPRLDPEHKTPHGAFDAATLRRDFPILNERINGRPLIWLDNAATTQKPQSVIDRLAHFYEHENSNIHRAAHTLAARATDAYEAARDKARRFLGAPSVETLVFVRGATEAINLVAQSWGRTNLGPGDEIVITWLEHHANIVPWKRLADTVGAVLRVVPVDDHGQVRLDVYKSMLGPRTKLVSMTEVSNALGTVVPVAEMTELAHRVGARVLVDGAQAVSHKAVDVREINCDWYVFSGHKVFGPTGIGVLYGTQEVLDSMEPWQAGGNMIADVTFERIVYQPVPAKFEAGTGNIADAVGLGAALDYVEAIGMDVIARYEHTLLEYGTALLQEIPGLRLVGTAAEKAGVLSFVFDDMPPLEVGRALNREGIAVRAGHHCAQPILRRFGLEATVRPSLALYNTPSDLEALAAALRRIRAGHPPPAL